MKRLFLALVALSLSAYCTAQTGTAAQRHSAASSSKSSSASPNASGAKQPSIETLNSFMHYMFGYDPNVKWKIEDVKASEVPGVTQVVVAFGDPVQQRTPFYVANDMQHAFVGQIIPFGADPFAPARSKLAAEARGPVQGNANAPVEIVEFSDFECPHCKRAQPILEKLISDSPNAKFIYENFPLSSIHKWADLAAGYGDCLARKSPEQFWKYSKEVFDQQEQITDDNAAAKLSAIAQDAGGDPMQTASCANSAETKARVNQQYELGVSLGVTSTPTLFISGRRIDNIAGTPYDILKDMVNFAGQPAQENSQGGAPK